jgi:hypothetical protein
LWRQKWPSSFWHPSRPDQRRFVPKIGSDGEPETRLVANEPIRVTQPFEDDSFLLSHFNHAWLAQNGLRVGKDF